MTHAIPVFEGQGWLQVGELGLAFLLSALVGLERQLRGKSAGLRTQAIVGTASALFLLVGKYGFTDVLSDHVVLDPSRVAAQIVSGIGFLGAGLILTRRGAVRGLTTAASVWETAAIGMAAGAGLWLLAVAVTALHFVVAYGLTAFARVLPRGRDAQLQLEVVYREGRGILRSVLGSITSGGWVVSRVDHRVAEEGVTAMVLELNGPDDTHRLLEALAGIAGVDSVQLLSESDLE
ncbi:MgtC/SapB family protein [Humibacter ginsenosidimutans]|uniref:MgtC/SapB family protein n=1 Tax=Humibacter ginsenosidimutans TaxID=2599293 RepID=A0A5B8M594_9MICO|nr:MgtC/SapB family protein [Humibacter ginsenosidimutans]QDZ14752.1 MgtC/SapB family protein [Humibacter ginsenosidimutans]